MDEGKQRKFGAILSYMSIIINCVIQLLYTPLLIRMLGQSEYGLYSLVASIIGYLIVLDFGFGNAIIVYTAKYRAQGKYEEERKLHGMFNLIFIIIGIVSALFGFILFLMSDKIFGNTMTQLELHKMKIMMLILSFNLMLTFSFSIYNSIISAYEKFTFQKIVAIISAIMKPALMIPLLFMGYKSIALSIIITIVNIIVVFSNYYYCKNKLNISTKFLGFDKTLFKVIFGYSIWIFLGVIVDKANWSVDQFVLGAVSGTIAVSIYSIASTLNVLFINLSTAISGVLLPKMSKMVANNASNEELTNEFIKVGRIQYYIIFLMCSGLVLFGKQFIQIWTGEGFSESYYVALLLIIPVCIPLIQNLGVSIRQAMNMHKFPAVVNIVIAVLNIIISIPLARKYGAVGAAVGTAIGITISIIINNMYYYAKIKLNIFKFWHEILVLTIKFFIAVIIIVIFIKIINLEGILFIVVNGALYTAVFCLVSYFICMNKYEKNLVKNIISRRR